MNIHISFNYSLKWARMHKIAHDRSFVDGRLVSIWPLVRHFMFFIQIYPGREPIASWRVTIEKRFMSLRFGTTLLCLLVRTFINILIETPLLWLNIILFLLTCCIIECPALYLHSFLFYRNWWYSRARALFYVMFCKMFAKIQHSEMNDTTDLNVLSVIGFFVK